MSESLPMWIEKAGSIDNLKLRQALQIAWEALGSASINFGIPLSECERPSYEVCQMEYKKIEDAIRRIEELGK